MAIDGHPMSMERIGAQLAGAATATMHLIMTHAIWAVSSWEDSSYNKPAIVNTQHHRRLPRKRGRAYAEHMLHVYEVVTAARLLNYLGAYCQLPSNLQLSEREALVCTLEDVLTFECLQFRFLVIYEGLSPTPAANNHSSVFNHPCDVAAYITKEVGEGAMLGLYNTLPFTP